MDLLSSGVVCSGCKWHWSLSLQQDLTSALTFKAQSFDCDFTPARPGSVIPQGLAFIQELKEVLCSMSVFCPTIMTFWRLFWYYNHSGLASYQPFKIRIEYCVCGLWHCVIPLPSFEATGLLAMCYTIIMPHSGEAWSFVTVNVNSLVSFFGHKRASFLQSSTVTAFSLHWPI